MPPVVAALPAIAGVASAGASVYNAIKGPNTSGGGQVDLSQMIPDYQKMTQAELAKWVQDNLSKYTPGQAYTGNLKTSATSQEQTGLSRLTDYLNSPGSGSLLTAANQQVQDTLGGKYVDPSTNPFIQSMINLSNRNLQDSITTGRRSAGARGTYYSDSAIKNEALLRERSNTDLNAQIGTILNQERQNQFNAVPIAQTLDQYQNQTLPLSLIGASQTYGGLQRTIDQANLEAAYTDYLNQRKELSAIPGIAQGAGSTPQNYGLQSFTAPVQESPNSLSNILGIIGKLNLGALGGSGSIWDKLGGVFKPAA